MVSGPIRVKFNTSTVGAGNITATVSPSGPGMQPTIFGSNMLDQLSDVAIESEADGAVPVFDASLGKFIIHPLSANNLAGPVDGGVF